MPHVALECTRYVWANYRVIKSIAWKSIVLLLLYRRTDNVPCLNKFGVSFGDTYWQLDCIHQGFPSVFMNIRARSIISSWAGWNSLRFSDSVFTQVPLCLSLLHLSLHRSSAGRHGFDFDYYLGPRNVTWVTVRRGQRFPQELICQRPGPVLRGTPPTSAVNYLDISEGCARTWL